jgi:hypothetical protein
MKTLAIKTGVETISGKEVTFSTIEIIQSCLNSMPEKGFTYADLKARGRIDSVLQNLPPGATQVNFEDTDFETLKECAINSRWAVRGNFILDFLSQIL